MHVAYATSANRLLHASHASRMCACAHTGEYVCERKRERRYTRAAQPLLLSLWKSTYGNYSLVRGILVFFFIFASLHHCHPRLSSVIATCDDHVGETHALHSTRYLTTFKMVFLVKCMCEMARACVVYVSFWRSHIFHFDSVGVFAQS